jgi:iron complex outermembrane receptor protein
MRERVIIALILCVATIAPPLSAQRTTSAPGTGRVVGTVVDAQTSGGLVAAQVQLVEPHRTGSTHENGTFGFVNVPAGEYTLQVERLGYRSVTQRVQVREGSTTRVRVDMPVAAIQLGEVLVTGTLSERARQDMLSAVSVLSGAELERRLDGTVAGTLQSEPGVAVTGIGPTTSRPVIRGLGGDRILVLEDGQRAGDLSSTSADHAVAIEAVTARRFEVVRGPMSLLYGSSALGGVVNVVRDEIPRSRADRTHGVVALQVASVNRSISGSGFFNSGAGPWAVRGEASARTSGDVDTPAGRMVNTGTRAYNASAGVSNLSARGHIGAAYRFYANDYGIPGGFVGGHARGVDIEMRRHTIRGELGVHEGVGPFERVEANIGYTAYHHSELEASGAVGTRFEQGMASGEAVAHHDVLGPFAAGAVGTRAQYRDITTGGSLRTPSTYDYTIAGFAVEEVGTGALRLQLGARYDWAHYVPRDTTATVFAGGREIPVRPRTFGSGSGSLAVLWIVASPVRIGASVSRAYRTPDFNELYSDGPHLAANSFDVGDPEIEHETGFGADAFLRFTSERFTAEAAAFRNQLSNYIFPSSRGRAESGTQGLRPRFQYTNEDAVFTGAEGDAEWNVASHVVMHGTVSYVRARFTSERAPIPVIGESDTTFVPASPYPPLIPPLHGTAGVRYERPTYFAGVETRWAARQERLGDFEEPTDDYALLNLSIGVRLARAGRLHAITLRADNALDTEYRDHLSRIKAILPQPGRSVNLLYRLTF